MTRELGAVILCYGPGAWEPATRLAERLRDEGLDPSRLVLVHNPSRPGARLEREVPGATVIEAERNLGYAGGMNLGLRRHRESGVDFALLLTMDATLEPGAVMRMREAATQAPDFGVLGPELRWAASARMSEHTSWGVTWSATGAVEHVLVRPSPAADNGIAECDSIDGSVMLIRMRVLDAVGYLTDRLFMYYEETEFCLRVKRAGWRVGVVMGAVAQQSSGEVSRPGAFNYLMARNGLEFARQLAGTRGVIAALGRYLMHSWRLVKMRWSPKSDRARRGFATTSLGGLWRGVAAFFAKRWGPPPPNLPGVGDVTYAS